MLFCQNNYTEMLFKYYVYVMSVSEVFIVCLDGRHRVMSVSEVFVVCLDGRHRVMSVSEVFMVCLDGRHRVMSVSEVFKATNTCVMFVCQ